MSHPTRPAARSLAEVMAASLDPLMRKRGLARAQLLAWWPEIVGEAFADATQPERIRWPRDGKPATLYVRCDPALALPLSYEADRVRERLNGFFGYPAVGAVKIVQRRGLKAPEAPQPPRAADPKAIEALKARTDGLDAPLRDALRSLGEAILARS